MSRSGRRRLRSLIIALITASVTLLFALQNRHEIKLAGNAIRRVRPVEMVIALGLVGVTTWNLAAFHAASQRAAGAEVRARELVIPVAAARLANAVVKSGAMAGLAPMFVSARRRGSSRASTLSGYLLVNVLGHAAFALTLVAGLAVLATSGRFTRIDALAAIAFTVLSTMQLVVIVLALSSRDRLRRIAAVRARMTARIRRRPSTETIITSVDPKETESGTATESSDELWESAQLLRRNPRGVGVAAIHALAVEVLGITELWFVLRALHVRVGVSVPIVAYAVSVLFTIVGFLPGGLGTVEFGLGALLGSYGLSRSDVIAAVVLYRILELWAPLAFGLYATHRLATEPR